MKKNLLLLISMLWGGVTHGQDWRIAPVVGLQVANINYSTALKNALNDFNSTYSNVSISTGPALKMQIGALLDYPFTDRLSFRTGLILNGKGGNTTYKISDYGVSAKVRSTYSLNYLELPLLLSAAVGSNDFRLEFGVVGGIAVSAKNKYRSTDSYYGEYTGNLSIGNDRVDMVKPVELGFSIGLVKQLEVGRYPLEVGFHIQPSISKWNTSAKYIPEYFARNLVIGMKAVYLFDL
ncbi:outer membrane beta-barrel protein [Siphonobacter sp. SORGH_AS_1065]|uniref:outer membrane beta-barrel protein n=1 Tax=Siphonobacter sp. SORGH_AS_1065 TaxID=3041795 RepID=UPI0027859D13|nr:outer membrane beta-barrel protein [Siphonobacter sp. SORGH_AS_1065]MDQ1089783.1 hypothetical protein [Siphonobacter sp. SORGH_AS_1065]